MFTYEMHQHTSGCSLCGRIEAKEMVKSIKESGFQGVVLTNHFYHGNTAIDRNLPWKDFCYCYEKEYYEALNEGGKIGVDVFYGIEEGLGFGKEVLLYGISPDLISKYPELVNVNLPLLSDIVRSNGGVIIQAHPFRERDYISKVDELLPSRYLDGYEVFNKHNTKEENAKALLLANKENLIKTAGTDCHNYVTEGRFGICCSDKIKDNKELAEVLKNGSFELYFNEDE